MHSADNGRVQTIRHLMSRRNRDAGEASGCQCIAVIGEGQRPGKAADRLATLNPLGDGEACLKSFGRHLRKLIPESALPHPPARGWSHG